MSSQTEQLPGVVSAPGRRRQRMWLCLSALVIGAVLVDGSRPMPADATRPIPWRGIAAPAAVDSPRLRVATFNIHGARGRDRTTDIARTAAVFDVIPDIIGLNEVRGTVHEWWQPDQAAQLGQLLKLESAFIPVERRWWHEHFGNGLLTRMPVRQTVRIPLVGTRGKAFRCATLVQFEFRQTIVQVLSVHVDSQFDREQQLRTVISLFVGLQAPAILIGDLNSSPDDAQIRDLVARPDVVDALRDVAGHRIDWILARGFTCHAGRLIENEASDHPAAVAELDLVE